MRTWSRGRTSVEGSRSKGGGELVSPRSIEVAKVPVPAVSHPIPLVQCSRGNQSLIFLKTLRYSGDEGSTLNTSVYWFNSC